MTTHKVAELEGEKLDIAVRICKGRKFDDPVSSDWSFGGPIIEADQIFLDPPHDVHRHGGTQPGWSHVMEWSATVSARTRTYPNPNFLDKPNWPGCVGRGAGPTALIAAMRAVVASYGYTEIELP